METLAQVIHSNLLIDGVTVGNTTHKIGLCADDIIVSLTDPIHFLSELQHMLDLFNNVSLEKINYNKSCMLDICLDNTTNSSIAFHYSFLLGL